jgi:hypothetical protein
MITLKVFKEQTSLKSSRLNYNDVTMWRQRHLCNGSENPTLGKHISAEDCMCATLNVFKDAIRKLLLNGYLDIQLGFTPSSPSSYSEFNNKMPSVEEVPLKTPSGEVLGFVWHVKAPYPVHGSLTTGGGSMVLLS